MKILLITILTALSLVANAQFRNTTWGMSLNEVKKIETEKLFFDSRDALSYKFIVEDMECVLSYSFNDKDQLISITYTFSSAGKYDQQILATTVKNITNKYGEPTESRDKYFAWNTDKFSIRAMGDGYRSAKVIYTPPAPSQKDIL